jgi:hypothetical protein
VRTLLFTLALVLLGTAPAAAGYEWRPFADEPAQVSLWLDGVQVGAYHLVEDYFRPLDPRTGKWGPRCGPPVPPPARNFGLVPGRIQAGEHFYLNGREVSRTDAHRVLAENDPRIPDDPRRWHLTVIGEPADREPVLRDLKTHPALRPWQDRLAVQGYDPAHWAVTRQGFHAGGRPTVYVQAADGTVLHRQDDYRGGAEALAEALRRIDPNYRPDRDPDRRRPSLLAGVPWSIPAAVVIAVVVLFAFRRKS